MRFRSASSRLLLLFASAACARGALGPAPALDERAALRHVIDSMLAAPEVRHARWGVLIVDPDRGDTLYSRDAGKLFVPASNMKVVTAAVALDAFGPDYRFATPILARGEIRDGVLHGDMLVVGRGDPSVSDNMIFDAMLPLSVAADSLRARGIRHVRGKLLAFGDAFPDANTGFGWEFDDLVTSSGAMFDELLFNDGIAQIHVRGGERPGDPARVRTTPSRTYPPIRNEAATAARGVGRDSTAQLEAVKDTLRGEVALTGTIPPGDSAILTVTHRDPSEAYLAALREALVNRGITVGDSVVPVADRFDSLFVIQSPPLRQILAAFMKPSQNQMGEMLFKSIALHRADTGTARVARRLVAERLRSWGAQQDGFQVQDGSGLSRHNLLSPETVVRVLDVMRRGPHFVSFYDALPVAGVDGTLRTRMRSTTAEANVRGKTGTLSNVRSLSGYVTTRDGRVLLFSVLCNNYLVSTAYVSRVQDSIAVRLSRLRDSRSGN
jgi:D-alanyl-D-alanine carboxypeptidase/D-alanyl-D-alanine-endopeptidase (penicillin-binding protein 4)